MSKDRPVRRPTEDQALARIMRETKNKDFELIKAARRAREVENRRLEAVARRVFGR